MRKLTILFLLITSIVQAQFSFDNGIFLGQTLDFTYLYYGQDADNLADADLTYNSTGLTVDSFNSDTVTISLSPDKVFQNSLLRFTTSTSGTTYRVKNVITDSVLILDQSYAGSTSDEMFIGSVGTLEEVNDVGTDLLQTTATLQPSIIYEKQYYFDADDYVTASFTPISTGDFVIEAVVEFDYQTQNILCGAYLNSNNYWRFLRNGSYIALVIKYNSITAQWQSSNTIIPDNTTVKMKVEFDRDVGCKFYLDNVEQTLTIDGGVDSQDLSFSNLRVGYVLKGMNGKLKYIGINDSL